MTPRERILSDEDATAIAKAITAESPDARLREGKAAMNVLIAGQRQRGIDRSAAGLERIFTKPKKAEDRKGRIPTIGE